MQVRKVVGMVYKIRDRRHLHPDSNEDRCDPLVLAAPDCGQVGDGLCVGHDRQRDESGAHHDFSLVAGGAS